eukprot:1195971-Prorocentrum_minimum.AAC.5
MRTIYGYRHLLVSAHQKKAARLSSRIPHRKASVEASVLSAASVSSGDGAGDVDRAAAGAAGGAVWRLSAATPHGG